MKEELLVEINRKLEILMGINTTKDEASEDEIRRQKVHSYLEKAKYKKYLKNLTK